MKRDGPLREGFTTGTAASGAAKAAALLLLTGRAPAAVDVPLPGGGRMTLAVAVAELRDGAAFAGVVKDGGDDPDVTHGALIGCLVSRLAAAGPGEVLVAGGEGVGRVTLPGLPVAVGQAAINPAPRAQIAAAVAEAAQAAGYAGGLAAVVSVAGGEAMARKTLNPRLGIVGGISILGVSGIVRPFSHQAWEASIAEALDVARALGHPVAGFSTGRRSEALLRRARPDLPETACVQAADCFAFAQAEAARRGFEEIVWAVFVGKLVKMAQGLANTHARRGDTDFSALSGWCAAAGWPGPLARQAGQANTARHAFDMAPTPRDKTALAEVLAKEALSHMRRFAGQGPRLTLLVFDFDGGRLAEA
ncbi:cobalamin biosynthesis protein CbiD [Solidesulfovibrio carbinoliphilus subsp. oakridgensis]|uniref:Cobalt-precorrin-5B C(1)-methyltransferase n=1 Tax=Solidesulfovibrio carbinoliphilus subsp. oakridgensis TaxID=694327 RepID=G7Q8Q2_9BACT|nr:cobalt-precorrin-5B (C(1))-methyltransferase CbiD [Solidesulfovibrio carbinoliphilus]EHJ49139.1 cobalamin biosynthesis protein CbiD [Solidesulfovibrio carbinoliphilus subsp. oakridgensis]